MNIKTKDGTEIDVTPWIEQMRENLRSKQNIFEQTPIGTTADKDYFWWDEEKNPSLNKHSVKQLISNLRKNK